MKAGNVRVKRTSIQEKPDELPEPVIKNIEADPITGTVQPERDETVLMVEAGGTVEYSLKSGVRVILINQSAAAKRVGFIVTEAVNA